MVWKGRPDTNQIITQIHNKLFTFPHLMDMQGTELVWRVGGGQPQDLWSELSSKGWGGELVGENYLCKALKCGGSVWYLRH